MERDTYHSTRAKLKAIMTARIEELSSMLSGLDAAVLRGELTWLMNASIRGRYTEELAQLKRDFAKMFPFRRKQAEDLEDSVLNTVFDTDTITRTVSAVEHNHRLSNLPNRSA